MHIQRLAPSHAPVFLVNSRYPLVCATPQRSEGKPLHARGSPLYRRHGSDLPSSLTRIRSIALVFSYLTTSVGLGVRVVSQLEDIMDASQEKLTFSCNRQLVSVYYDDIVYMESDKRIIRLISTGMEYQSMERLMMCMKNFQNLYSASQEVAV